MQEPVIAKSEGTGGKVTSYETIISVQLRRNTDEIRIRKEQGAVPRPCRHMGDKRVVVR